MGQKSACVNCAREFLPTWGRWASPTAGSEAISRFAPSLQFRRGKDGGQAGEEGRASASLLPPGVSEANFFLLLLPTAGGMAHSWHNLFKYVFIPIFLE